MVCLQRCSIQFMYVEPPGEKATSASPIYHISRGTRQPSRLSSPPSRRIVLSKAHVIYSVTHRALRLFQHVFSSRTRYSTFLNGKLIRFVSCSASTVHTSGPPHSVAFPLKLEKRNLTCLLTGVPTHPLPAKVFLFTQGCGIAGHCGRYHDGFSQLRLQKILLNTFFQYVKYCPGST